MSKSMAQMADEILGGALTDPSKNPHDPAVGHQAHMPMMDHNDTLLEMNDTQRAQLMGVAGVPVKEEVIEETKREEPTPSGWGAPTTSLEITPQDLETLSEAKRIIEKIQEATTVGTIGVNMAGGTPSPKPKKQTVPGNVNVTKPPKKRVKAKTKKPSSDFLAYLKA